MAVDAGHGGIDPGSPCRFCPRGVTEKDVTLAIARQLRRELERRGVSVIMTRTKDTLISLYDRAKYCEADCDLFVSLHVDALEPGPGYQRMSGIHVYFLGEARTADARRVAAMGNDALRYAGGGGGRAPRLRPFSLRGLRGSARSSPTSTRSASTRSTTARPRCSRSSCSLRRSACTRAEIAA